MLGATAAEQAAGSLAPSTLEAVTEQLLQTGFCVLGNVVPHAVLDQLNPQLDLQAAQHVALSLQDGGAAGLQAPARGWSLPGGFPRTQPHCHPLIVTNPLIEQVVAATLEEGAFLSFCNGNCNATRPVPGAPPEAFDAGGLHHDGPWVFRTRAAADEAGLSGWPHQPTALVVNFGTNDLLPENGATEIWPGSHAVVEAADKSEPDSAVLPGATELAAARRPACPPTQMSVPRGAVCFRDMRLWHRAVLNPSGLPRHMLALGYSAALVRDVTIVNSTRIRNGPKPESERRCRAFCPPKSKLVRKHYTASLSTAPSATLRKRHIQCTNAPDLRVWRVCIHAQVFSESCAEVFVSPSRYSIDRNVELTPGPVDTVGLSVPTVDVAPALVQDDIDMAWEFSVGFSEAGVEGGVRRLRVARRALPDWANRSFEAAAANSQAGKL